MDFATRESSMHTLTIYFTILIVVIIIVADLLRKFTFRWVDEDELEDYWEEEIQEYDLDQEEYWPWQKKLVVTSIIAFVILFIVTITAIPYFLIFKLLDWIPYPDLQFESIDLMLMASFSVVLGTAITGFFIFLPLKILLTAILHEYHSWILYPICITIDVAVIHTVLYYSPGVELVSLWAPFMLALLTNIFNYFFSQHKIFEQL